MKKKIDSKILERLPGDLRELAEIVGDIDIVLRIVDRWSGTYINVAACDDIKREIRIAQAQELYDAGGITIRDLALRFHVTGRTMQTWLKLEPEDDVPPPLLALMK
jgi:hypothetical protein